MFKGSKMQGLDVAKPWSLDLGFGVEGSGFRVEGLGFRVEGLGFRVEGLGFGV